jgi:hypothetical protein
VGKAVAVFFKFIVGMTILLVGLGVVIGLLSRPTASPPGNTGPNMSNTVPNPPIPYLQTGMEFTIPQALASIRHRVSSKSTVGVQVIRGQVQVLVDGQQGQDCRSSDFGFTNGPGDHIVQFAACTQTAFIRITSVK